MATNKRLLFKIDGEEVPDMVKLSNSKVMRDIIKELILSEIWGISGMDFLPGKKLAFKKIPRKHIRPATQIISLGEHSTNGIPYDTVPNIWVVGEPDNLGELFVCSFYSLLKMGAVSDWAEYIQLFGSPVMVMTYDALDEATDIALDKAMNDAGHALRLKIPKQAGFEMKDGKTSNGDGKLQDTFRRACNEENSVVILGNTETTTASKSSGYAQSKTHAGQQSEITKADMDDIIDLLNSDHFFNILRSYGYPVDGGEFEFDKEIDIEYLQARAEVDDKLVKMGLPVSKKAMYKKYDATPPESPEDAMGAPAPAQTPQPKTPAPPKPKPQQLSDDDQPVTHAQLKQMFTDFFGPAL